MSTAEESKSVPTEEKEADGAPETEAQTKEGEATVAASDDNEAVEAAAKKEVEAEIEAKREASRKNAGELAKRLQKLAIEKQKVGSCCSVLLTLFVPFVVRAWYRIQIPELRLLLMCLPANSPICY